MNRILFIAMLMIMVVASAIFAEEADVESVPKYQVINKANDYEVRVYDVKGSINGKMITPEEKNPVDVDFKFSYKIKHAFEKFGPDRLIPLNVSMIEADYLIDGQKVAISTSEFPKITIMLDKRWQAVNVFGYDSVPYKGIPGINYRSFPIFFILHGGDEPRKIGDKWNTDIKFPPKADLYNFTTVLKSIEKVSDIYSLLVNQEVKWIPKGGIKPETPNVTAKSESYFAIDSGKLLKSHIECEVIYTNLSDVSTDPVKTKIALDISLSK